MTDPIQFPATTPRHGLPLLFAGQSQKEFFINDALSGCDALLHPLIEGEVTTPPVDPADDSCWLVATGAGGAFAGQAGCLAFRQSGEWTFAPPRDGMRAFDRSTGQFLLYVGGWRRELRLESPAGGQTVDFEARTAIDQLIAVLQRCGILPVV